MGLRALYGYVLSREDGTRNIRVKCLVEVKILIPFLCQLGLKQRCLGLCLNKGWAKFSIFTLCFNPSRGLIWRAKFFTSLFFRQPFFHLESNNIYIYRYIEGFLDSFPQNSRDNSVHGKHIWRQSLEFAITDLAKSRSANFVAENKHWWQIVACSLLLTFRVNLLVDKRSAIVDTNLTVDWTINRPTLKVVSVNK